jgi:hypothetical protein
MRDECVGMATLDAMDAMRRDAMFGTRCLDRYAPNPAPRLGAVETYRASPLPHITGHRRDHWAPTSGKRKPPGGLTEFSRRAYTVSDTTGVYWGGVRLPRGACCFAMRHNPAACRASRTPRISAVYIISAINGRSRTDWAMNGPARRRSASWAATSGGFQASRTLPRP